MENVLDIDCSNFVVKGFINFIDERMAIEIVHKDSSDSHKDHYLADFERPKSVNDPIELDISIHGMFFLHEHNIPKPSKKQTFENLEALTAFIRDIVGQLQNYYILKE